MNPTESEKHQRHQWGVWVALAVCEGMVTLSVVMLGYSLWEWLLWSSAMVGGGIASAWAVVWLLGVLERLPERNGSK